MSLKPTSFPSEVKPMVTAPVDPFASQEEFVRSTIEEAKRHGYRVEPSKNGRQIDFGNKTA